MTSKCTSWRLKSMSWRRIAFYAICMQDPSFRCVFFMLNVKYWRIIRDVISLLTQVLLFHLIGYKKRWAQFIFWCLSFWDMTVPLKPNVPYLWPWPLICHGEIGLVKWLWPIIMCQGGHPYQMWSMGRFSKLDSRLNFLLMLTLA